MIGSHRAALEPGKFKPKRYITLPRYLCIDAGTVYEDFEDFNDWTVGAGATPSDDAVNYKTGTKSVCLDTTEVSNIITKTVSWDFSSVQDDAMEIWIRWESAALWAPPGAHSV